MDLREAFPWRFRPRSVPFRTVRSMTVRSRSRVAAALLVPVLILAGCASETSLGEAPQSSGAGIRQS